MRKKIDRKANAQVAILVTIISVIAVMILTNFGISKGLPGPVSFPIVLAALFGIFAVRLRL